MAEQKSKDVRDVVTKYTQQIEKTLEKTLALLKECDITDNWETFEVVDEEGLTFKWTWRHSIWDFVLEVYPSRGDGNVFVNKVNNGVCRLEYLELSPLRKIVRQLRRFMYDYGMA